MRSDGEKSELEAVVTVTIQRQEEVRKPELVKELVKQEIFEAHLDLREGRGRIFHSHQKSTEVIGCQPLSDATHRAMG